MGRAHRRGAQPRLNGQHPGHRISLHQHRHHVAVHQRHRPPVARRPARRGREQQIIGRARQRHRGLRRHRVGAARRLVGDDGVEHARAIRVIHPARHHERLAGDRVDPRQHRRGGRAGEADVDPQFPRAGIPGGHRHVGAQHAVIEDPHQHPVQRRPGGRRREPQIVVRPRRPDLHPCRRQITAARAERRQRRPQASRRRHARALPPEAHLQEPHIDRQQIVHGQIQHPRTGPRRHAQLHRHHRRRRPQRDHAGVDARAGHRARPALEINLVRRQHHPAPGSHRQRRIKVQVAHGQIITSRRHRPLEQRRPRPHDLHQRPRHQHRPLERHVLRPRDEQPARRSHVLLERDVPAHRRRLQPDGRRPRARGGHVAHEDEAGRPRQLQRARVHMAHRTSHQQRTTQLHHSRGLDDPEGAPHVDGAVDRHRAGREDGQVLQRLHPADVPLDHHVPAPGHDHQALGQPRRAPRPVRHPVQPPRDRHVPAQRPRADRNLTPRPNHHAVVKQLVVPVRIHVRGEDRGVGRANEMDGGIPDGAQQAHDMNAARHLGSPDRHRIAEGIGAHLDAVTAIRTTDRDAVKPVDRRPAEAIDKVIQFTIGEVEHTSGTKPHADGLECAQRLQDQRAAGRVVASGLAEIPAPQVGVDLNQIRRQHDVSAPGFNARLADRRTGHHQIAGEIQNLHVAAQRANAAVGFWITRHTHVADGQAIEFQQIDPGGVAARACGGHFKGIHLDKDRLVRQPDSGGVQDAEVGGLNQNRRTQTIRTGRRLADQQRVRHIKEDRRRLDPRLELQGARADDEIPADVDGPRDRHHSTSRDELKLVEAGIGDRCIGAPRQPRARDHELVARQVDVEGADCGATRRGEVVLNAIACVRDGVEAGDRVDGEVHRDVVVAERGEVERVASLVREFHDRVTAVARGEDVGVVAGAARQRVVRRSAHERVVARTAVEDVACGAHASAQPVVAVATVGDDRHVHAGVNLETVVARAAIEVDAGDAREALHPGHAVQQEGHLVIAAHLADLEMFGHIGGAVGIEPVRGVVARAQDQRAGGERVRLPARGSHVG